MRSAPGDVRKRRADGQKVYTCVCKVSIHAALYTGSTHLSVEVHMSFCLHLSICICASIPSYTLSVSIYPLIRLFIYQSIHLPISLPTGLATYLCPYLSIRLYIYIYI